MLFHQKKLMEQAGFTKPPTTFAELLTAAQATTKQGAPNRFGFGVMGRQGPAMLGSFTPFLRSAGGHYYDAKTGDIHVNQPAAVEALQFYGDLMTKYHVMNPASLTWEFDGIIAGGQADQFAMTVTLAPYGEAMNDPKVSKTGGAWGFSLMPGKVDIKQSATYLAGWMLGVPEKTKNTEWAFEFIQMATSKQWLRRSIDLANSPPRVSVLEDPAVLATYPWAPVAGQAFKTAVLDHRDPLWAAAELPLRTAISEVLLGQRTAQQAMDEVANQWRRSFRLTGMKGRVAAPMTEIGFYHLTRTDPERALPQLLGRTLAAGQRAAVLCASAERLAALDEALWQCQEPDWLPHGTPADGDADLQPIWLTTEDASPNGARFLFLIDGAQTARVGAFERVFDLFDGKDEAAAQAARERWAAAKAAGHTLTYWRQGAHGWEKID